MKVHQLQIASRYGLIGTRMCYYYEYYAEAIAHY